MLHYHTAGYCSRTMQSRQSLSVTVSYLSDCRRCHGGEQVLLELGGHPAGVAAPAEPVELEQGLHELSQRHGHL